MNPDLMLVLFGGSLVFLAITVVLARIFYKKHTGASYSCANRFPFELFLEINANERRNLQIPLALYGLATIGFFYTSVFAFQLALTYIIVALSVLAIACFVLLFYIRTTFVDRHVLVASLAMILVLMLDLFVAYYAFTTPFDDVFSYTLRIGALVLGAGQLLIMINPRLKQWARLEAKSEGDTISFSRPRFFVLPASEWLTIINVLALQTLMVIALYI